MRLDIEITGTIDHDHDHLLKYIMELLDKTGVSNIHYREHEHYEDWLAKLPNEAMPGLSTLCLDWIRHWGNGGGDLSSETCITDAINDLDSEAPKELAEAIFGSIDEYSKSHFDAAALTIEMIGGCIEEIMAERREIELNYEEDAQ